MLVSEFNNTTLISWIKKHRFLANVLLAIVYIGLAQVGYQLANVDTMVSPLWPPAGVVIAAVVFGRRSLFPGVVIGELSAQLLAGNDPFFIATVTIGVLASAMAADALYSVVVRLERVIGNIALPLWLIVASVVAPLISSSIGVASMYAILPNPPDDTFFKIWSIWWIGNVVGAIVIAPVLLTMRVSQWNGSKLLKAIVTVAIAGLIFSIIFYHGISTTLVFLAFPVLLIACHWFGAAGSAWATLGFVTWATIRMLQLDGAAAAPQFHEQILLFNFLILALATTSLTISTFYHREFFFIPAVIFLIGWSFCGWLYFSLKDSAETLDEVRFIEIANEAEHSVQHRLNIYTDALRSSAAYFMNSKEMTHSEWRDYVKFVNTDQRYPGINGLGFIMPFTEHGLSQYVKGMEEQEAFIHFKIKTVPGATRPPPDEMGYAHYIITHIEPIEANRQALGLDTASESNRQGAARKARDSGIPTMTNRITLVQDGKARPGFLIYLPIYKSHLPLTTATERREAFIGWSYAPFVTESFLSGVLGARSNQINFEIYDAPTILEKNFVYGDKQAEPSNDPSEFDYTSEINLAGQIFSFGWTRGGDFQAQETSGATIAAASLAIGTCLLVGMVVNLQSTNRRVHSMVEIKTTELLKTNDHLQTEVYERKKAEAEAEEAKRVAEAANFAKSDFLATMSHEIRTPMNSVIGFSELLASSNLSDEQILWTEYIQSSGNSLLHIINDILDISKIEAGKLPLETIPFSLIDVVSEVIGSLSTLAKSKGLTIDKNVADVFPATVKGDPLRVKQILTNLLSNALKFTRYGTILVNLEWLGNDVSGTAHMRITDTGIGIPPDKLASLFDKFTQVDSSTTRRFGGTGLGLAICKQLTYMMQGSIKMESHVNKGTTVFLSLPFECLASNPLPSSAPAPIDQSPALSKTPPNVLIVDDNSSNQKLGLVMLRRLGCAVSIASDGKQAIESIMRQTPAIIFMDCQMPIMDGYEATQEIRKLELNGKITPHEKCASITIIALTANASMEDKQLCIDSGMDDYLSKPCKYHDLKKMLDTYWSSTLT